MRKNDAAWQRFFDRTNYLTQILSTGACYVTANELKEFGQREPRLMAKLDTLSVRPRIFKEHRLSIFPISNGKYVIFRDDSQKTYFDLSRFEPTSTRTHVSGIDLEAFDAYKTAGSLSESQALDFAFLSSLTHSFLSEEELYLVIRGRAYSGEFGFWTPHNDHRVSVSGVQIEIDAGYESTSGIYLLEAKVGRRSDFHIRQLYYPFLEWSKRSQKRVVPIFLTFTNGQYVFTQFQFNESFGDLEVCRSEAFIIDERPCLKIDLPRVLSEVQLSEEGRPYPQANDLDKVVDLTKLLFAGDLDKSAIADFFEFDERQGDYYANAGCYLGLLEKSDGGFSLTACGRSFASLRSRTARTRWLLKIIASYPSFREILKLWSARSYDVGSISKQEISRIIEDHSELRGSTPLRRASTVKSWLAWFFENCDFEPGN